MATRNRTTPSNMALFVGPTPATGAHGLLTSLNYQITRVQSLSYNYDIPKEDVLQYGNTARISREQIDPSNVTLDFSYYLASVDNEYRMGLFIDNGTQNVLKYLLDKTQDEKNYFVFVAPDNTDAAGLGGADGRVKSFGNGFINSYSLEAAVGGFPTVSVSVQASNMVGHADGVSEQIPAINTETGLRVTGQTFTIDTVLSDLDASQLKVIKPGDISLTLTNAGGLFHSVSSGCVQSFRLGFDLNRQGISCLGLRYPKAREIQFPIDATFQVEMLANDIVTGDLSTFVCETGLYNAQIAFRRPNCTGVGDREIYIDIRGMSLESQNWTTQVGNNSETLTINWLASIGGSGDLTNGVFISGATYS